MYKNYFTLHRSDLAARAANLDRRLGEEKNCFEIHEKGFEMHPPQVQIQKGSFM